MRNERRTRADGAPEGDEPRAIRNERRTRADGALEGDEPRAMRKQREPMTPSASPSRTEPPSHQSPLTSEAEPPPDRPTAPPRTTPLLVGGFEAQGGGERRLHRACGDLHAARHGDRDEPCAVDRSAEAGQPARGAQLGVD